MTGSIKNEPIWTSFNPVPAQYPWLANDEYCEVCIIGGGITGAMAAYRFSQANINTVLVTANPIGFSGTSTAPPYIRYDGTESLTSMSKRLGARTALETYRRSREALDSLETLVAELGTDVGFKRCDSVLYTDNPSEIDCVNEEFLIRRQNGFNVEFLNSDIAKCVFSFDVSAAIISKNLAAIVDPYRLAHALIEKAAKKGARIYENTKINKIENQNNESILHTDMRHTINAKTLIIAIGNDCCEFLNSESPLKTSFATVSPPIQDFTGWPGQCIISTWSKPNITVSTTPDSRVFASGLETGIVNREGKIYGFLPGTRISEKKYAELSGTAEYLFPDMRIGESEYAFSGSYAETEDGLPVIGEESGYNNCYFALCPGSDSILYSEIAGRMLLAMYFENPIDEFEIYSAGRFD